MICKLQSCFLKSNYKSILENIILYYWCDVNTNNNDGAWKRKCDILLVKLNNCIMSDQKDLKLSNICI